MVVFWRAVSRAVLFMLMRALRVPLCWVIAERYFFTSLGPLEGSLRSSSWNLGIVSSSACHGESMVVSVG